MDTQYIRGTVGRNGSTKRVLIDVVNKIQYLELKDDDGNPSGTMIIFDKDHNRVINQPWESVLAQLGVELGQQKGENAAKKTVAA